MKLHFSLNLLGDLQDLVKDYGSGVTCQYSVVFDDLASESTENIVAGFRSIDGESKDYFDVGDPKLLVVLVKEIPVDLEELLKKIDEIKTEKNICSFLFRSADGQYKFFSNAEMNRLMEEIEDLDHSGVYERTLFELCDPDTIRKTNTMLAKDIEYFNSNPTRIVRVIDSKSLSPELITTFGVEEELVRPTPMKNSITLMDLSGQNLYKREAKELKTIFSSIPESIQYLSLCHNLNETNRSYRLNPGAYSVSDNISDTESRKQFFEGLTYIPPNIVWLNLSDNHISDSELERILPLLPKSLKFVLMDKDVLIDLGNVNKSISHVDNSSRFFNALNGGKAEAILKPGNELNDESAINGLNI